MKLRTKILIAFVLMVGLMWIATPTETEAQTQFCKACLWSDSDCEVVGDGFGYASCGLQLKCTRIFYPSGDSSLFCYWVCRQSNPCLLPPG